MSRISINFTQDGSNTPEVWRDSDGIDLKTFLQEAGTNTAKVAGLLRIATVHVDGEGQR